MPGHRALAMSLVAVLAAAACTFTATIRASRTRSVLKQDGLAYFLYARSLVLDLDLDVTDDLPAARKHFLPEATEAVDRYSALVPSTGRVALAWPVGMGVVMAPFYAAGLAIESLVAAARGTEPDSYSTTCQVAFATGSLLFAWLGFWCTVACCRRAAAGPVRPPDAPPGTGAATLATLAAALGGPLVFYVFFHPAMSHAASFGAVALMVLLWWRAWDRGARPAGFAAIAFLCGLVATMRYQGALFAVLPAALLVRETARGGVVHAARCGAAGGIAGSLPVAVQVAHLAATYGGLDPGAAFAGAQNPIDPSSPHFLDVLFSCLHGAFYWAPVLAVGAGGLIFASVRHGWARLFLATFLAHVWLVGSLGGDNNWHAAASFGMRYLVECTPVLAAGLAVLSARAAPAVGLRWQAATLAPPVAFNLALILAYSLRAIPQEECVTWPEMAAGVWRVVAGF